MKKVERYKLNKELVIGDKCFCPSCNECFVKTQHQQAFCKNKPGTVCKDAYWNSVTPNKRNNTTRISPANARWKAFHGKVNIDSWNSDDDHPFSSDAMG